MAKPPRVIPPVRYHPETGSVVWHETDDFDPLDKPLGSILDTTHIAEAVLRLMEEYDLMPDGVWTQIALAECAREPLRVGDLLSPLLELLGQEPYRDLPAPRPVPSVIDRNVMGSLPGSAKEVRAQYASLYLFIDDRTRRRLTISENRAAKYCAIILGHMADIEIPVVEEFLSGPEGGVLPYQTRERLNWWRINGSDLTDLYDSLCKTHKCTGDCEMLHIQGLDTKGIQLLATVLQEPEASSM